MVKNGDCSVITQTSLHQVAVCVINSFAAIAQISPTAGQGCENRQKNEAELLHIVQSINSRKSATALGQLSVKKRRIVLEFPATT